MSSETNREPAPALSAATRALFDREIAKYPADQKQSAVMACLRILQRERGYLNLATEEQVAHYLGMAPIAVHEVTTFYNMYNQRPVGRYKLNVCTNLPCQLRDGARALRHLEHRLGIKMGETTSDGLLALLRHDQRLDSPVMLVNDETMCSFMSNDKLDQLIDGLRAAGAAESKAGQV